MSDDSKQTDAAPPFASVTGYAAATRKRSRFHCRHCTSNPLVWLVRDSSDGTLWRFTSHHGGEAVARDVCDLLNKQHNAEAEPRARQNNESKGN